MFHKRPRKPALRGGWSGGPIDLDNNYRYGVLAVAIMCAVFGVTAICFLT